jgi:parallel beta-helix repeat protein
LPREGLDSSSPDPAGRRDRPGHLARADARGIIRTTRSALVLLVVLIVSTSCGAFGTDRAADGAKSAPAAPAPSSAEPTGTGCTAEPSACDYPDSSSTGAPGTNLPRVPDDVTSGPGWHYDTRGWVEISGTGAVFSGYQVHTGLNVSASNVTIKNNVIDLDGPGWGIALRRSRSTTIDHNTIRGTTNQPCDNGIRDIYGDSDDVTITANNIYYCSSAINHFDAGGLIKDNYFHDLGHPCLTDDPNCGHFNGIQLGSGTGPLMTIDHNTILNPAPATDAIMLANDDGDQTNRTITNNLLAGGGYTLYGSGWEGATATKITVTNNTFSTRYFPRSGSFGPVAHWQQNNTNVWSGNTWADGPQAGKTITTP